MNTLKKISPFVSLLSLAIIILFGTLRFLERQSMDTYIMWTNLATVVWFCFSPWWLISWKERAGG